MQIKGHSLDLNHRVVGPDMDAGGHMEMDGGVVENGTDVGLGQLGGNFLGDKGGNGQNRHLSFFSLQNFHHCSHWLDR